MKMLIRKLLKIWNKGSTKSKARDQDQKLTKILLQTKGFLLLEIRTKETLKMKDKMKTLGSIDSTN